MDNSLCDISSVTPQATVVHVEIFEQCIEIADVLWGCYGYLARVLDGNTHPDNEDRLGASFTKLVDEIRDAIVVCIFTRATVEQFNFYNLFERLL